MSHKKYSSHQIEELLWNEYVKSCTEKYITFTDAFKIYCLKQNNQWIYYRDIFRNAGFPEYIIQWAVPKESMWNWKHAFRKQWWQWIISKKKGRKKKEKKDISKMSLEEQNEYLRAEVAYLRELYVSIHEKSP